MVIIREKMITQDKADIGRNEQKKADCSDCQEYGLVLDIGTTTVAMSLHQLATGRTEGGISRKNCQTLMGKEVMMRLMHCQNGHQEELHRMIIQQTEEMAEELWRKSGVTGNLRKMVVVGNPAMCHIFLNQPVQSLAVSPSKPAYQGTFCCGADALGMHFGREMHITVLPGIAGHVGADAVAVILDQGVDRGKVWLAADIGTNAEIILNNHGKLSVCSAAAGPAFEGMGINCGMRGENGAIASVRLAPHAGNILLEVLKQDSERKAVPKGICGSGLIDAVAQMVKYGILQHDGYLPSGDFILCSREDGGSTGDIYINQQDIRNFQTAKAAVQAGMQTLLESNGLTMKEVDQVVIAGVFGSKVSEKSAKEIGLFPDVEPDRLKIVGNAAIRGAQKVLLEENVLQEAQRIAESADHIELAEVQSFQNSFLKAMELSPWK